MSTIRISSLKELRARLALHDNEVYWDWLEQEMGSGDKKDIQVIEADMEELEPVTGEEYWIDEFPEYANLISDGKAPYVYEFRVFTSDRVWTQWHDGDDHAGVFCSERNPVSSDNAKLRE